MRPLSMSIVCILCGVLSACVSKQTYVDATQRAAQEREALREQLRATEDLLQETENERDVLTSQYANLQARYRLLENQHRELATQLDELSTQTATLQTNLVERESVLTTQQKIEQALRDQIAAQEIKIEEIEGKLKMTLLDTILFATGKAQLNAKGQRTLLQVATSLRDNPEQSIVVEGHTDNVPIGSGVKHRFATNWELSAARATAVVRFLQDRGGVAPERLGGCGYSAYRPVVTNDTTEGRHQNRRIELVLIPPR
ncbi:chemotaxis protein MotB [Candidatus Entotheonella serta]|nr:chemotaxis protein MotB [Candidatus Entotheonella serta]